MIFKKYAFKKRHILYLALFVLLCFLYFIGFMTGIYRHCIDDNCVSVAKFTKGRDTFLRVYDRPLYSTLFNQFYDYAEYPLETGVLVGKQLENNKIVVISDILPKIKGDLSQTMVFKQQTNAYYSDIPNSIQFDKLPHF